MAYETGAYSDVTDLVNKLATFIEANGWTRDDLSTAGSGRRYHAHRSGVYLNMRGFQNETADANTVLQEGGGTNVYGVTFNLGTGYSGGSAWYGQAGTPQNSASRYRTVGVQGLTAAGTYHFFAQNSGDQIIAVVEYASGYYARFCFGSLVKYGTWAGGMFMVGSRNGIGTTNTNAPWGFFRGSHGSSETAAFAGIYALINVDVDAETGWHFNPTATYGSTQRTLKDLNNVWSYAAQNANQPNTLNSLAIFFPVVAYVNRSTTDSTSVSTTPIGELPGVFYCTLANLVPGQQVSFGGDDYRVFPMWSKNTTQALPTSTHSGWYGFAVKE